MFLALREDPRLRPCAQAVLSAAVLPGAHTPSVSHCRRPRPRGTALYFVFSDSLRTQGGRTHKASAGHCGHDLESSCDLEGICAFPRCDLSCDFLRGVWGGGGVRLVRPQCTPSLSSIQQVSVEPLRPAGRGWEGVSRETSPC